MKHLMFKPFSVLPYARFPFISKTTNFLRFLLDCLELHRLSELDSASILRIQIYGTT